MKMRYAYFDPSTGTVLAWIDTDAYSYPELPDASMLREITAEEDWHEGDGQAWYVVDNELTTVPPPPPEPSGPTPEQLAMQVRARRTQLLGETDWLCRRHRDQADYGTPTSLSEAQYNAVLAYRQSLRDLPAQTGFPANVDFPASPV